MRILYLHQYFLTPEMAGGTRSYEMARRWAAAGHDVHVITSLQRPDAKRGGWTVTQEAGVTVHWFPVPYSNKMSFPKRIASFARFASVAGRRATRISGDVVFATSTPLTIAIPAMLAIRSLEVPMVFEVRDLWPELPVAIGAIRSRIAIALAEQLERRAYYASAAVVALSPGMAQGVARTGYPRDKIVVVPNSCDVEFFQSGGLPLPWDEPVKGWMDSGPIVLYAGTLGAINGVSYLVDVAAEANRIGSPLRFLIVGSGAEEDLIRRRAQAAGVLNNNLRLMPPISKECMPALFARATIASSLFIDLPQMWNNSANKFFDALAAGKPIVINYHGWQKDLLDSSGAGFAVPPRDTGAAARLLTEFVERGEAVSLAGAASLGLARTRFNRDVLAQQLLDVLKDAVQDAHGSRRGG
jgi:glycosyltransferase involved in cell wall biosynthesis